MFHLEKDVTSIRSMDNILWKCMLFFRILYVKYKLWKRTYDAISVAEIWFTLSKTLNIKNVCLLS